MEHYRDIYDILIEDMIKPMNINIHPKDVLNMIHSIDSHRISTEKQGEKDNKYQMILTATSYLLAEMQIDPELVNKMNNSYNIPFHGMEGDNGILFFSSLLNEIIHRKKIRISKNIENDLRDWYIYIKKTNNDLTERLLVRSAEVQLRHVVLPHEKDGKWVQCGEIWKPNALIYKVDDKMYDKVKLQADTILQRPNIVWGMSKIYLNEINSLLRVGSILSTLRWSQHDQHEKQQWTLSRPIQVPGIFEEDSISQNIKQFSSIKKEIIKERNPTVLNAHHIFKKSTIPTIDGDRWRELNSTLLRSDFSPTNKILETYCHRFDKIYPPPGKMHFFVRFNSPIAYSEAIRLSEKGDQLTGDYKDSYCIHCGTTVDDIYKKIKDREQPIDLISIQNKIIDSQKPVLRLADHADDELISTAKFTNLTDSTINSECDKLISFLEGSGINLDTINKNIKTLFTLDEWQRERQEDLYYQFGSNNLDARIVGTEYQPLVDQVASMKSRGIAKNLIDKHISNFEETFNIKEHISKMDLEYSIRTNKIKMAIQALKRISRLISTFSNETASKKFLNKIEAEKLAEEQHIEMSDKSVINAEKVKATHIKNITELSHKIDMIKELMQYNGVFKQMKKNLLFNMESLSRGICHFGGNEVVIADKAAKTAAEAAIAASAASAESASSSDSPIFAANEMFAIQEANRTKDDAEAKKAIILKDSDMWTLFLLKQLNTLIESSLDNKKTVCTFVLYILKEIISKKEWSNITQKKIRDIRSELFAEWRKMWNKKIKAFLDDPKTRAINMTLQKTGFDVRERNEFITELVNDTVDADNQDNMRILQDDGDRTAVDPNTIVEYDEHEEGYDMYNSDDD